MTGGRLVLPEPLHDENAQSWLKGLAANGWDVVKQLLHLLTLYLGVTHGQYLTLWEMATPTLTAGIREMTGGGS